jgi:hypothetical protein
MKGKMGSSMPILPSYDTIPPLPVAAATDTMYAKTLRHFQTTQM